MNAPLQHLPIAPTANSRLERQLLDRLARRAEHVGTLGELEPLAVRLGLMQNTLKPSLDDPQLVIVAGDHGLAVDGIPAPQGMLTHQLAEHLLLGRLPVNVLARANRLRLTVVDAGMATDLPPQDGLLARKVAHGTRNARMGHAMTLDQAHAALRVGMELAEELPGQALLLAGVGVGSRESAALILSRLTDTPVRDLFVLGNHVSSARLARVLGAAQSALGRHHDVCDPIEVLAALGGFEMAVLAGMMLVAAGRRQLIVVDGVPALAAVMVASRLAPAVTDYCVFCRSHPHPGLDNALALFRASAVLEMGMDSADGTGAALAWPLIGSAAMLMSQVQDIERPTPPQLNVSRTEIPRLSSVI